MTDLTETKIYRRSGWEDKELLKFPKDLDTDEDITNIQKLLISSMDRYSNNRGMGTRAVKEDGTYDDHYIFNTYSECKQIITEFGFGLHKLGLVENDKVGIYAVNRPEWDYADFACCFLKYVSIPLYESIGTNAIEFIVNHGEVSCIICSNDKLEKLAGIWDNLNFLKLIILMDPLEEETEAFVNEKKDGGNINFYTFEEVRKMGEGVDTTKIDEIPEIKPTDVYTIMYTSGTTGDPKGVPITHGNILSSFAGALACGIRVTSNDSYYSYLPLGHILERMVHLVGLYFGGRVGFFTGNIKNVIDEIQILGPSIFIGVPRVYNKIYSGVLQRVSGERITRRALFHTAKALQEVNLKIGYRSIVLDKLVFSKTKEGIGGNVRMMISGSAPLAGDIQHFMETCFDSPIVSGYGMTEAYPITLPSFSDREADQVGQVMPHMEMKLQSIPEMGYNVEDTPYPRGEILVRGPAVFDGYYKRPELTEELFEDDGFFHTGDIGQIIQGDRLKLIDRRKNIFKLSQGEYVAAEKLEALYGGCCYVEGIFVYGNSYEDCLIAIVSPDIIELEKDFKGIQLNEEELNREEIIDVYMNVFKSIHKDYKLHGFERIRAIYVTPEPFSVENNLITPTLKLKRHNVEVKYKDQIDAMYRELKNGKE